ncbi:MAG: hypothetical protein BroJett021_35300 [Chloroflexota bacterium]|nr:MAG: hypothetical protein BroJett021_35300 [Chloroflexota bacterium]
MSEISELGISVLPLIVSLIALWRTLPMTTLERMEYEFYLQEFSLKIGARITWRQKLSAWNGAKGGRAPKWHWIPPVKSPFECLR